MTEKGVGRRRGGALLDRLGGPPGPYATACVVLAVIFFLFGLLLDRGDPIAEITADSGLRGALWALMWLALGWLHLNYPRAGGPVGGPSPLTASARRERARRGAIVGLGIGVPFFVGLILLCLRTGQSLGYVTIFTILLTVMAAVAARSLRSSTPTSAS